MRQRIVPSSSPSPSSPSPSSPSAAARPGATKCSGCSRSTCYYCCCCCCWSSARRIAQRSAARRRVPRRAQRYFAPARTHCRRAAARRASRHHAHRQPTFARGQQPSGRRGAPAPIPSCTILRSINAHRISLSSLSCLLRATSSTARRIIRIHHPPHLSSLVQPSPFAFAAPLTVSPFVFVACLRIRYAYERACLMHEWPMAYIHTVELSVELSLIP